MIRRPLLAMIIALCAMPSPGMSAPTPPPFVAQPFSDRLSATALSRLRANGLDPADPALAASLAALARSRRPSLKPTFTAPAGAHTLITKIAASNFNIPSNVIVPGGLGLTDAREGVQLDHAVYLDFSNQNVLSDLGALEIRVQVGDCAPQLLQGISVIGNVPPKSTLRGAWASGYSPLVAAAPAVANVLVNGSLAGVTSWYAMPTILPPGGIQNYPSVFSLPVGDGPPFVSSVPNALGLSVADFTSTNTSDRVSTNPSGNGDSGIDTLGYGVHLVNGWQATASITSVRSYQDGPEASPVSVPGFRTAEIVQQPANGTLETKVKWTYAAGESVNYTVTWTFTNGAMGGRMVDSEAKEGSCPSEQ